MNASQSLIDNLYLEQRATLIKVLFRIVGCYQTAEDLSQEAYLKVSAAVGKSPVAHPRPFLYQTARNLALDHLRKEKVRGRGGEEADQDEALLQVVDPLPNPEKAAATGQAVEQLLAVLSGQPRRRREILILYKVHGWRYDEIAAHFGISRSAVEKNIRAALAACLAAGVDSAANSSG